MKRSISYSVPIPAIPSNDQPVYAHHQWIRTWIESILERPLPTTNLFLSLRDGVFLCRLVNQLKPNSIVHIHQGKSRAAKEENIRRFLEAGPRVGLQPSELFQVDDLYIGKDMNAVIWTLYRLAMITNQPASAPSWSSYDLQGLTTNTMAMMIDNTAGEADMDDGKDNFQETHRSLAWSEDNHQGIQEDGMCSNEMNQKEIDLEVTASAAQVTHLRATKTCSRDSGYSSVVTPLHSFSRLPSPPQSQQQQSTPPSPFPVDDRIVSDGRPESPDQGIPPHLASLFERPPSPCSRNSSTTSSPSSTSKSSSFVRWTPPFANLSKKFTMRPQTKTPFHMRYQEWADRKTKPSLVHLFQPTSTSANDSPPPFPDDDVAFHLSLPPPPPTSANPLFHPSVSTPLLLKPKATPTQPQVHQHHNMYHLPHHAYSSSISPVSNSLHDGGAILRRKSTGALQQDPGSPADAITLLDPTGQVPGKYKLGNVIGKGQFGVVYRALELRTGKMVAVKRIKVHSSKKRDIANIMQEARLLQSLDHVNIVRYEGLIRTPEHLNIILEFVENGSLLHTLKGFGGSFSEDLVAKYCAQILHGLEYLHAQNVVHCDLKAANLLTTKSGHLKLSDFGVSLHLVNQPHQEEEVAGTPYWMAPEVIALQGASTKSDIWSLGCTLIELCTGKPPYSEFNHYYALYHIVEDDYPSFPAGFSDDFYDFLRNCFAKQPEDRPSATELLLHAWIYTHADAMSEPTSPVSVASSSHVSPASLPPPVASILGTPPIGLTHPHQANSAMATPRDHLFNASLSLPDDQPSSPATAPLFYTPPSPPQAPLNRHKSASVLVDKFQQQQRLRQVSHRYVKGTFPKGAIKCKSCQLAIKKDALICEDCGFICHDKCKSGTICQQRAMVVEEAEMTTTPRHSLSAAALPAGHPHHMKKPSLPTMLPPPPPRASHSKRLLSLPPPPKPMSSMSTHIKERTRKLSRVFSTRQSSNPPATPPSPSALRTSLGRRSHPSLLLSTSPGSSRSEDLLRPPTGDPLSRASTSSISHTAPPRQPPPVQPQRLSSTSSRGDRPRRRPTNPDDCIIS